VADVPVGMFLSAGIDSALITALSVAHGERPHTLTLAFAEYVGSANDESPLAEQLAAQLGTRHATVMVRKADFIEQREQLLAAMDQPSIDGVNTWFVSQAAASQGIKVALSGLGGDERMACHRLSSPRKRGSKASCTRIQAFLRLSQRQMVIVCY
jgi:asparagine synthase (glutamine-hydrolysing)